MLGGSGRVEGRLDGLSAHEDGGTVLADCGRRGKKWLRKRVRPLLRTIQGVQRIDFTACTRWFREMSAHEDGGTVLADCGRPHRPPKNLGLPFLRTVQGVQRIDVPGTGAGDWVGIVNVSAHEDGGAVLADYDSPEAQVESFRLERPLLQTIQGVQRIDIPE